MTEAKEIVPSMGLQQEIQVTPEQIDLIKKTVAKDATDDELKLFIYNCKRLGTHPLDRMIHFVKRDGKATFQSSIDYFRSLAEESGDYDGQDEPEFEYGASKEHPALARVRVYKKGVSRPIVGVAHWNEYCPKIEKMAFMWRKMPTHMVAKCAEALALRKAFPKKLAGMYIPEELARPDDGTATTPPKADSVRPASAPAATPSAPAKDTPKDKPVKEALYDLLDEYCAGDAGQMVAVLKEVSIFGSPGNEKWIGEIAKVSDKWCGKALRNLRERMEAEKAATEDVPF